MKKISYIIFALFFAFNSFAQEEDVKEIKKKIDELTYGWDLEAVNLESYEGLGKFCSNAEYRYSIIDMLNEIHHYDSVLYERAKKASEVSNDKELIKLIKDIEKFEEDYSMKDFISFLRDECNARKSVEKDSENLKAEVAEESYDEQVYLIELECTKYIKHITTRVDKIRDHVHHLVD